jgi:putative addiction module component (TIGR02574 family)
LELADPTGKEVKMSELDEALKHALSLDVRDRAALAEKLLASLEDLPEEEADRLWAEEAQRRLDAYRAGRARAVRAEEVHEEAERLFR